MGWEFIHEDRRSGGGRDRKRSGELTREARSASLSALCSRGQEE